MTFPVYFHLGGVRVHPHPVMEVIAYSGGFQLYRRLRPKFPSAALPFEANLWIIIGALSGALAGSKILALAESAPEFWAHRDNLLFLMGGKTIVGGLLGGWLGVEIAKHFVGVKHSTGDAFVFPLIFGMAVGRVGCFLTGLDDHTYGVATSLPWAVDFGDGIRRHPTQLYDIVFLCVLAIILWPRRRSGPNGQLFLLFVASYCAWRFAVEYLKPSWKPIGLSAIQIAVVVGFTASFLRLVRRRWSFPSEELPNADASHCA